MGFPIFCYFLLDSLTVGQLPELPEMDNSRTPTYDDVALYTLRDLGGLIQYNENNDDEDFIWFAITERMKESLCLFYYTLEFDPIPEKSSRYVVNVLCKSVSKNSWVVLL